MLSNPYDWIEESLETIHRANWYRSVKNISGRSGAVVELEGRSLINFASNDYLGLAGDERLIQAAIEATKALGTGSTGSRLLSGHRELHRELESAIASLKQTEDALIFSSGYLANLGTITALIGQRDLIFSDQYNHSSLKNGAKLSGAKVIDYLHCNLEDLETKLHQYRQQYRRCLILTDSVFSMDGDLCPLPQLLSLAEAFDCMVLVDEAHATGVMGETGAGCVEHFNCTGTLIQMGTLSKALGSLGGYVAGSTMLIDFLRNRAATWIYTTGLSPADTAAALEAIKIVKIERDRRQKLWNNVNLLKQQLSGLNILPSESPIICLSLDTPAKALAIAKKLNENGIFAPAIRPPTVPTSRIRFSVMATHESIHIQQLGQVFDFNHRDTEKRRDIGEC
ncbi:MAG: 8-amino-7-oxononanoate synthase [Hydrococcus sp. Prado102]|jgi:8-amino-7-oxononanoate synthase|nr:8-amino-7-oxononanoate synthase [Hydrococcus sp. Prado102]